MLRPSSISVGGASRLVDYLVDGGFEDVTVLDLSQGALEAAKGRLGGLAARVHWIVADATIWEPPTAYDIWHDRAAFHFLTEDRDRAAYVGRLERALKVGGHATLRPLRLTGRNDAAACPSCGTTLRALARPLGARSSL
jgi:SAM-dependent methyltransferase